MVCRQLGYGDPVIAYSLFAAIPIGNTKSQRDFTLSVQCNGTERDLSECQIGMNHLLNFHAL